MFFLSSSHFTEEEVEDQRGEVPAQDHTLVSGLNSCRGCPGSPGCTDRNNIVPVAEREEVAAAPLGPFSLPLLPLGTCEQGYRPPVFGELSFGV